jgi:CheY-like chemotaxis protein
MKTLLILEDESAVMTLLRQVLKRYNVIEATTADQALQAFADHTRQIDLLVADVSLPTSSGIRVALKLRAETRKLPVILASGYPVSAWNARDATDLERLGPDSVMILQKPFGPQFLLDAVHQLIGEPESTAGGTA